jgi:hypothetical protein
VPEFDCSGGDKSGIPFLSIALRVPWIMLAFSLAAVVFGVLLYTGDPTAKKGPGQPALEPWQKGLETGLMPSMDEGAFILDYFAPTGSPLISSTLLRSVHSMS